MSSRFFCLNLEFFIAKRIQTFRQGKKNVSRPAVNIAAAGIAVGIAVMIIAVGIVTGFKKEVRNKLIGFGSHIQISSTLGNQKFEARPISISDSFIDSIASTDGVIHVQKFAFQPGILKTNDNFHGIAIKGIDQNFNWDFFKNNMIEGDTFLVSQDSITKKVLISQKHSKLLNLKTNDKFLAYFIINGKVRVRPLCVSGIYKTGFNEYDNLIVIADIKHITNLNGWDDKQCNGLEILIEDYNQLDEVYENIFSSAGNHIDKDGNLYTVQTIKEINPQIFSWLDLLDINVVIILILMVLVSGFTMISGLLILILEKTNMIGILKALGCKNWSIRKIFLYQALLLAGKGLVIGNAVSLILCWIQHNYKIIKLDQEIYYIDAVPISLTVESYLIINSIAFLLSAAILIGPSYIITKISPDRAIRFE